MTAARLAFGKTGTAGVPRPGEACANLCRSGLIRSTGMRNMHTLKRLPRPSARCVSRQAFWSATFSLEAYSWLTV